jgi:hypothetical protein
MNRTKTEGMRTRAASAGPGRDGRSRRHRAHRRGGSAALLLVLLLGGGLAGCRSESPVAGLEVQPAAFELPAASFVEAEVTLTPEVDLPSSAAPTLFVHLLDRSGELVRTFDQPLPAAWRVGETQRLAVAIHQSALGPSLPAGAYALTVGLWDPPSGKRFSLRHPGKARGKGEVEVAAVTVPAAAPAPSLELTGPWRAGEPGADRQVLMRRGFSEEVTVVVGPATAPGQLLLAFALPPLGEPRLELASSCDGEQVALTGGGRHQLTVAVSAAGCTLTLRPLFPSAETPAVGLLEVVAWRPAAG